MKFKKTFSLILCVAATLLLLASCGQKPGGDPAFEKAPIPDGVYSADFKTDSSMFHVNEAYNGKGTLTVKDGKMTIHVTMPSKNSVNLFFGTAEDAQKDGAKLIQPTTDTVTYEDGTTEEVYGFDIPVPYLDREFDCALIGTKGKWYDHKVSVSDPVLKIEDGEYTCEVTMTGGSGRASIQSPAKIAVKNGVITATVVWSSSHYELMTVNGVEYKPVTLEGGSTFEIPAVLDADMKVSALTTAMSEPHTIEYVLHFDGSTLEKAE